MCRNSPSDHFITLGKARPTAFQRQPGAVLRAFAARANILRTCSKANVAGLHLRVCLEHIIFADSFQIAANSVSNTATRSEAFGPREIIKDNLQ